jgi:hypothetical protein
MRPVMCALDGARNAALGNRRPSGRHTAQRLYRMRRRTGRRSLLRPCRRSNCYRDNQGHGHQDRLHRVILPTQTTRHSPDFTRFAPVGQVSNSNCNDAAKHQSSHKFPTVRPAPPRPSRRGAASAPYRGPPVRIVNAASASPKFFDRGPSLTLAAVRAYRNPVADTRRKRAGVEQPKATACCRSSPRQLRR